MRGEAIVNVGERFISVPTSYDTLSFGKLSGDSSLEPFEIKVDKFVAQYNPKTNAPEDYTAWLTVTYQGRTEKKTIKVNKSLNEKEKSLQDEIEQRKISEKRLRKLFSELQLAYERVNHFSQMVSHNLRSPIANLKGIVTILNETENTEEEKKEYLNAIFVAAHKLDNVIIDMNEILSIQKDLTEKNKIVVFEDELNSILISEKNTFEGKNIKILADFEEIPKIQSVNSFIHSILHNLITNAIKYRKPNTECIIKLKTYTKDEFVFLSVEDNGLGIDLNKNNNKIFKPYKRFHSHVEGRGLGLYLVQTQAQMLGGDVSIESELNIGTKFIVNLGKKDI